MKYLEEFYKSLKSQGEFNRVVASCGFLAYVKVKVEPILECLLGDCINKHITIDGDEELWRFILGDLYTQVSFLMNAFENFVNVRVKPIFSEKEFEEKTLEYLKNHIINKEYFKIKPQHSYDVVEITEDIWNNAWNKTLDVISDSDRH